MRPGRIHPMLGRDSRSESRARLTLSQAGPRVRPRDATASSGRSQAATRRRLMQGPGRDSLIVARPSVGDAIRVILNLKKL